MVLETIFWAFKPFLRLTFTLCNLKTFRFQSGEYMYMYNVIQSPADTRIATHKIMTLIVQDLS